MMLLMTIKKQKQVNKFIKYIDNTEQILIAAFIFLKINQYGKIA